MSLLAAAKKFKKPSKVHHSQYIRTGNTPSKKSAILQRLPEAPKTDAQ